MCLGPVPLVRFFSAFFAVFFANFAFFAFFAFFAMTCPKVCRNNDTLYNTYLAAREADPPS